MTNGRHSMSVTMNSSAVSSYNFLMELPGCTLLVSVTVTLSPRTLYALRTVPEYASVTSVWRHQRSARASLVVVRLFTLHLVSLSFLLIYFERHAHFALECLGDWFPENKTYPTRSGDIWSLGVILVNLVCGRNPWRIASPSDESFNSYLADPHFLRKILPVSDECLYILTQIFTVHPEERITLPVLRQLISKVETFSMTVDELRHAHISAQQKIAATQPPVLLSLPKEDDSWSEQEELFAYDDDMETPSLRSDTDSPRYPLCLSPTTSSNGESLPPTPNLIPDECIAFAHQPQSPQFWEYVPKVTFEYDNQRSTDVHIKGSSLFTYNSTPTTYAQ